MFSIYFHKDTPVPVTLYQEIHRQNLSLPYWNVFRFSQKGFMLWIMYYADVPLFLFFFGILGSYAHSNLSTADAS